MPNALQQAGALSEPSNFAPLHTNRMFTGLWTNRSFLRDAATNEFQEKYGMGRQDSILAGYNSELTPRLTLKKRAGSSVYNANDIAPVKRFYSFNTFTLTDETIRVMADTATDVLDITNGGSTSIWTKASGAGPTFFLGVGNILYFTNGLENKQWDYTTGNVWNWGTDGPTSSPSVSQAARVNPYQAWPPGTVVFAGMTAVGQGALYVLDPNGNMQYLAGFASFGNTSGVTGTGEPGWAVSARPPNNVTNDGQLRWHFAGPGTWQPGTLYPRLYAISAPANTATGTQQMTFVSITGLSPTSGAGPVNWPPNVGATVQDGSVTWQNIGKTLTWDANIGANQLVQEIIPAIVDPNGYLEKVFAAGKTSPASSPPGFSRELGDLTTDTDALWLNAGAFAPGATAPVRYGYAYMNSATEDITNMSPPSNAITVQEGNQVMVHGVGSPDPQDDTVVLYRTAQGGSTFLEFTTIPNPGAGVQWSFIDNSTDDQLDTEWQAQVAGEGTPLPTGATCLGYHLQRIFAAVGNVVWISSGPDATPAASSGNAGFDTTFTAQSKITRFWTCSLGMVVFTVRDAYIILGSATPTDPLYMVVFIEDLPLRSYDCFTVNKTTPYLLMGNNMLVSLDPSAGIIEAGFPIADRLIEEFDSAASYVTFHKESSLDTALYVANGADHWYRMAQTNAPESGSSWSPRANFSSLGCVQSVEVTPGQYRLLMSGTAAGPILYRDRMTNADNGVTYPAMTRFGSIVLALPGQLAALSFVTLESVKLGTRPTLALLLGELSGNFEVLNRTRQDPTNLPPSNTIFSDRYHFAQNQKTAWCRHFQMEISWVAEDVNNELLTFTIFGQTWQEMKAQ